ncbi:MAG: small basic protein [Planctomycetota bacterium]|nr:MAG: small basic protein [Planctomycetota bacterium]
MSVDRSLKIKGALRRHRNVLTRAERIEKLKEEERWTEGDSVFALAKVAHRKSHAGRKAKEAAPKEELPEGAEIPQPEEPQPEQK